VSDISRCFGLEGEVICQSCYRNRPADPIPQYVSFFEPPPIKEGECQYYIPTTKEDEL
jgi:hypothetical protein